MKTNLISHPAKRFVALSTLTAALACGALSLTSVAQDTPPPAQGQGQGGQGGPGGGGGGRRNFDPEQMRQRMMERYREQLEIKDDAEWKIIEERINKVSEARREAGGMGMGGFGRPGGRGGAGGPGGGGGRGGFGGEPSPEAEALQKAVEGKASAEELKTKLAKYREARKEKEAKLEQAQDELRKLLSVRQEAAAVLAGLLK